MVFGAKKKVKEVEVLPDNAEVKTEPVRVQQVVKAPVEELFSVKAEVTQTTPVIAKGEQVYTIEEALVEILNKLETLEKAING
jgi:SepF-like predicted cell division protein (DUF552 family)